MLVLLLLTAVGCILVGWLMPLAFKSERPYGLAADILIPTIIGLIYATILYLYLAPMFGLGGWLKLFGSALEATGLAAVILWIMRRIKR